jgi:formylglycine-generating enzyme required for sulfatase activity
VERENLTGDAKGKGASGSNREAKSTEAPERGGSQWDNKQTAPVGSFKPNAFGLYDMQGNVWQWVEDCYKDNHDGAPTDGSAVASVDCRSRVVRGGSWGLVPRGLTSALGSALRFGFTPGYRFGSIGFRVGRTLTP